MIGDEVRKEMVGGGGEDKVGVYKIGRGFEFFFFAR